MAYFCFCDYELTLTGENNIISSTTIQKLKDFLLGNKLCIISYASYFELEKLAKDNDLNIDYYSMSHSFGQIDHKPIANYLDTAFLNHILKKHEGILYTAFMTNLDRVYIYKYQERLNFLYPKGERHIISEINDSILNITIAVNKPDTDDFYRDLKKMNASYTIIASDLKRDLVFIASPATKKEIVKTIIQQHPGFTTVGIGDSYSDYEFIELCEIQAAMKNGDIKLKELCKYSTKLDNTRDGCISFLLELNNT